jgi:hypothetical protein
MLIVGYVIGFVVTEHLDKSDECWAGRIGHTRWRYANLPVGGVAAGILALIFMSIPLAAMALGMAVAAIQWRFIAPLPKISEDHHEI